MSHYHSYRGRCTGRILHFLHSYCSYYVAEHSTIGTDKIMFGNTLIATFTWNDSFGLADVPMFEFVGEYEYYNETQTQKRQNILKDQNMFAIVPENVELVSATVLSALIPEAYRKARMHNSWHNERRMKPSSEPKFYVSIDDGFNHKEYNVYFETCMNRYVWNNDLKSWLLHGSIEGEKNA